MNNTINKNSEYDSNFTSQNDEGQLKQQLLGDLQKADARKEQQNKDVVKDIMANQKFEFDSLTPTQIWGYGVGHFYNDACAAIWFNYLLFFLTEVKGVGVVAPFSMLGGQIADGLATPLVGFFSDKINTRLGQRIPWFIGGLIVVTISFLPIYLPFIKVDRHDITGADYAYYIFFPSLFNIGWAAVQIAHMSLVPQLTCSRKRRDILNGRRNTFTFVANIQVLATALILFQTMDYNYTFPVLAVITAVIGIVLSIFFLSVIKEVELTRDCQRYSDNLRKILKRKIQLMISSGDATEEQKARMQEFRKTLQENPIKNRTSKTQNDIIVSAAQREDDLYSEDESSGEVRTSRNEMQNAIHSQEFKQNENQKEDGIGMWFKNLLFYQCGIIYMGVRLYCNVVQTMLQFYIIYILGWKMPNLEDDPNSKIPYQVALIPLILFLVSTGCSYYIDIMYIKIGRKKVFSIGTLCMLGSAVGLALLDFSNRECIYVVAIFIGIAQALVLNTGITLISDVIGVKGKSGAFVFGFYSLLDKISTGLVLFALTNSSLFPKSAQVTTPEQKSYIRWVTVAFPLGACILAWVFAMIQKTVEYSAKQGKSSQSKKNRVSLENELAI